MANRQRFRVGNFRKRGTFWGRSPADTGSTGLAAATAVIDSTALAVAEGETITRIRGMISVKSDQAAANENYVGALGVCVVTDQAVAVGVGSVPTPYSDQDFDGWMLHQYFAGGVNFASGIGLWLPYERFEFDSKAQRKFAFGQTMCFVVENGSAASGIEYFLNFAVLFKVA